MAGNHAAPISVDQASLGEQLIECHRKVGPLSRYRDFWFWVPSMCESRFILSSRHCFLNRRADDPNPSPELNWRSVRPSPARNT